ncbi:MAG TPA: SPASM domain-containing protein [Thermoplasmatales archaeon]|nr:SPASM domain-containing protein [Thermoplasmatales archaeon]
MWKLQIDDPTFGIISTAPQFTRIALQYGKTMAIPTHFHPLLSTSQRINEIFSGCGAGTFYCGIGADGTVYPCIFLPIALGNLLSEDIETLWKDSKILSSMRQRRDIEICGKCAFKYLCGGCRSRAYAYHGTFLGPDPGCILCSPD